MSFLCVNILTNSKLLSIKMPKQLVAWNETYLPKILQIHNKFGGLEGSLPYISMQPEYNNIVKINSVFSSHPRYMPVDRTLTTVLPFKTKVPRPWKIPTTQLSLDEAMAHRTTNLLHTNQKINIMWSGGIDSTAIVTSFLKNNNHLSQLRILYSPWSMYEHPDYLDFIKKFAVETVDISGTRYMNWDFDGVFVTGDGGDEFTASIDESFFTKYKWDILQEPWQDLFYSKFKDDSFMDFCQKHFLNSGRPIDTILEARWWFYATCKSRSIFNFKYALFFDNDKFDIKNLIPFYDCDEFEQYVYWNIDKCIPNKQYSSWKQPLKDYIKNFDGLTGWADTKEKYTSSQLNQYLVKKIALKNQRWLALFDDGSRATTPSLPLFSANEYTENLNLDWVFNDS